MPTISKAKRLLEDNASRIDRAVSAATSKKTSPAKEKKKDSGYADSLYRKARAKKEAEDKARALKAASDARRAEMAELKAILAKKKKSSK